MFALVTTKTSSFSSSAVANASRRTPRSFLVNYLTRILGFSKTVAAATSKNLPNLKSADRPDRVLSFLCSSGFSQTHIRDAVRIAPQVLVADVEKILKPKVKLFQGLGLEGSDLGLFLSKNSTLLTISLDRKLIPCINVLKSVLSRNDRVITALRNCRWILCKDPSARLLPNIAFLQSCGIVGSQLSTLLQRLPFLFAMKESALHALVGRVKGMGFSVDSRMFVYALQTVSSMKPETLQQKLKLFEAFGFSKEESMAAFRSAPSLLRTSEKKLRLGLEFFLNTVEVDRATLVRTPRYLMYSLEERVIPRTRVVEMLTRKKLWEKPSLAYAIDVPEVQFLLKYILRFGDEADELLAAYKGVVLTSPA
ncbi:hypothetical protein ACLOJK_014423 [Asimina triloba]